ncbi:hypothetical protein [Rhizobium sp. AG207R]|uniref:hypothetical protein n=1 Tax=Rhizobium sp. AG207R TaxID=2802287 RepID=UPI0022ABEF62|nr:hypothetical protein [Rhizobium sp. AG207R]MCZ3380397.1 hypothetical protein [Rhizobium sp. AG207R]
MIAVSGVGFYRVAHRYFFQSHPGPGWAIIALKRRPTELDNAALRARKDEDEYWGEIDRQEAEKRERELRRQLGINENYNAIPKPKRPRSPRAKKPTARKK